MEKKNKPVSLAANFWRKLLGIVLLIGTVGLVSCQASFFTIPWQF